MYNLMYRTAIQESKASYFRERSSPSLFMAIISNCNRFEASFDSTFLNGLQNKVFKTKYISYLHISFTLKVNKWIREILKVTKLDRDPSSGTALQALLRLQEKREGIPHQEFEKVMSQCHEVFNIWDDEYDKLQGLMRDNLEKGDEHLNVNVSHKRRQERMQHMVKFRRQHEQRAREDTMVVWLDELQYQKGVWSKCPACGSK